MEFRLYKGAWLPTVAPHLCEKQTEKELVRILGGGGYFIKNTYDFDCEKQTQFWFVIKDSFGGIEELKSKKRNQVRKSLQVYDIRKVDKEEMLRWGYDICTKAIEHYKVKAEEISQAAFEDRVRKHSGDFWMAYEKETGTAVAFSINILEGDSCNYSTIKVDPKYLGSTYPMYGLIYKMNEYYLQEKGFRYVNDGARSITEHSNIQPFLIQTFNFRKAYCRIQLRYQWWFGVIVKFLYPFRKVIKQRKVHAILYQEWMYRHSK